PHDTLLATSDHVAAARVGVVILECLEDVVEAQVQRVQTVGVDLNLIRLELAAEGVDLNDARKRPELVADVPVEDRAQLHEGVAVGRVRLARLTHGLAANLELVDLTEPARDRTKL